MRLADFILENIEPILNEWDTFAGTIFPDAKTDKKTLRDHSEHILRAAVRDMGTVQSETQRHAKSKGQSPSDEMDSLNSASRTHGVDRLASGFDLLELFSEYRALRASVLRLWAESGPGTNKTDIDDITRFNEAIDQSLGRALRSFTQKLDQSRDMFLAILGHDLRNPLSSITMSAQAMPRLCKLEVKAIEFTTQIWNSAKVMEKLIADVLDYTRTRLGGGMPVDRRPMDLTALALEVVAEFRVAHPSAPITVEAADDLTGEWDANRLRQVISNLLGNALQHGDRDVPIAITLSGDATTVSFAICNGGVLRARGGLATIFDPLVRGANEERRRDARPGSIGLGLYIARELVVAHGGTIDVTSDQAKGTEFTFRLPRGSSTGQGATS